MIDVLEKIDELKAIKKMVEDGQPRYTIADKCQDIIDSEQKKVDEFEKWAEEESKKDFPVEEPIDENIQK